MVAIYVALFSESRRDDIIIYIIVKNVIFEQLIFLIARIYFLNHKGTEVTEIHWAVLSRRCFVAHNLHNYTITPFHRFTPLHSYTNSTLFDCPQIFGFSQMVPQI